MKASVCAEKNEASACADDADEACACTDDAGRRRGQEGTNASRAKQSKLQAPRPPTRSVYLRVRAPKFGGEDVWGG